MGIVINNGIKGNFRSAVDASGDPCEESSACMVDDIVTCTHIIIDSIFYKPPISTYDA